MSLKTIVHIIPHAHWDREWYMPLELHRARLVKQLDNVLDLLENDSSYTYHLDGQMIAVEDYLMFRPQKEEQIKKFVLEGRLHIGPWYVLQDEYLTSGEANVRNLLHGLAMAKRFGKVCKIGYLPDAFGNVGQMPQLFSQAEMTASAFGRGVTLAPEAPDPGEHFPGFSEFNWESPDGSSIPALFFAGWYNNAQEIPADPAEAKEYWDLRLAHARKYASTRHLLFLNGGDHQPVQKDLSEALNTARKLYPDIDFICSDFEHFAESVLSDRTTQAETVTGELAGQESDGTNTLCNTASAHVPIKILNRRNESMLSLTAEPLISMAAMAGMKIDNALLDRAWKLLIQNHPHDSICSCGVDSVNREVISRFEKSMQLGNHLTVQACEYLAERIQAPDLNNAEAAFAVFNPSGWERSQVITFTVGVGREYGTRDAYPKAAGKDFDPSACYLCDSSGNRVSAQIEDTGTGFGYDLPDDTFRKPYFERKIRIVFHADKIPAYGYAVYYLKQGEDHPLKTGMRKPGNCMENSFLSVHIRENGTFDITDKTSGNFYSGLGRYEDVGDAGDEYVFRETIGKPIMTGESDAKITCTEDSEIRTVFRIDQQIFLPVSADSALTDARNAMVHRLDRNNIARASETAAYPISTYLTLEKNSPILMIRTELNNTVKDHRLRMLFPTDLITDTHLADSVFDVVERKDVPGPNWTNPSRCQRMQYFAAAEDEQGGLAVINRGMYEYEILPERKQIAVTILRSVGEMGDWGVFPTPDAQCLGPLTTELAVFPYKGRIFRDSGCREAVLFQTDMPAIQIHNANGTLPGHGSFLNCCGKGLVFSALKPSEDEKALIFRVCNVTEENSELCINLPDDCICYESSIVEEKGKQIRNDKAGKIRIPVGKKEIKSIRIESSRYE